MKNAVITGATKGLGRAIAERLAEQGYHVWISARREADLAEAKQTIEAKTSARVSTWAVDFSDKKAVGAYAQHLVNVLPSIDVLVNNVGIYTPDQLTDNVGSLEQQMAVNFFAPFCLTQALLPRFVEAKTGNIFNVCSVVNRNPRTEAASYTVSKFAFWGYHKVLHQTLLPHGVKVTAFFPSSIATASWQEADVPFDEFIQPDDIAQMMVNILHMKRGTVPSEIDLVAINPNF